MEEDGAIHRPRYLCRYRMPLSLGVLTLKWLETVMSLLKVTTVDFRYSKSFCLRYVAPRRHRVRWAFFGDTSLGGD
jgi:hypothetical protein